MNRLIRCTLLAVLLVSLSVSMPANISAQDVDHRLYGQLLKKHVKNGWVSYAGLQKDEAILDDYLKVLEKVEPQTLAPDDQFAFYVNAYNAWTLKLILSAYPGVKSIKELGSVFRSPWKKKICRIDGKIVSLDHIEHNILRTLFQDPRVHFAVNCASKSCPPLRNEPYEGAVLDRQLDEMTRAFINDPSQYRFDGRTLYVSEIFKWFSEDFNNDVIGFFKKYAHGVLRKQLDTGKDRIKVKYLDYDWSLNGI